MSNPLRGFCREGEMLEELFGADGYLIAGRHEVDLSDIKNDLVDGHHPDRQDIWHALNLLLSACKGLLEGGVLLIEGGIASTHPGPTFRPTVAIVPEDPSDLASWSDAEEARFLRFQSLHDVVVGSLGPDYFSVLHPISGLLEVLYCDPGDSDQLCEWMGTVTMSDGSAKVGARGVLEVAW
jgi:hypothetical protein